MKAPVRAAGGLSLARGQRRGGAADARLGDLALGRQIGSTDRDQIGHQRPEPQAVEEAGRNRGKVWLSRREQFWGGISAGYRHVAPKISKAVLCSGQIPPGPDAISAFWRFWRIGDFSHLFR